MADRHLAERRNLLGLAKRIMANREENLANLDAKYKTRRERLLLKVIMARLPMLLPKRKRLLRQLGVNSKVLILVTRYFLNLLNNCLIDNCIEYCHFVALGLSKAEEEAVQGDGGRRDDRGHLPERGRLGQESRLGKPVKAKVIYTFLQLLVYNIQNSVLKVPVDSLMLFFLFFFRH